jgi:hypothetical protein
MDVSSRNFGDVENSPSMLISIGKDFVMLKPNHLQVDHGAFPWLWLRKAFESTPSGWF